MDTQTCRYSLSILPSKRIPVPLFSRLLALYGSARALIDLPRMQYRKQGITNYQIDLLKSEETYTESLKEVEAALAWSEKPGNQLLCYESKHYPRLLREIDTAPPILFVRGSIGSVQRRNFALVGSRSATAYGKRSAYWMARELAAAGMQICSGLAAGVDTKAHESALDGNGKTIAVVGTGIDRVYPPKNARLADRITENGALLSEFPLGTPPLSRNFPRRNRIISGLSEGTLVVEATTNSGSLITARLALEKNRDVFALPVPISSQQSRGCHELIKQGATLVKVPADILDELGVNNGTEEPKREPAFSNKGFAMPDAGPVSQVMGVIENHGSLFESIQAECELPCKELHRQLIELEGLIYKQGGRYFRSN